MRRICRTLVVLGLIAAGCTAAAQEGASGAPASGGRRKLTYRIVDTGQDRCYDDSGEIAFPAPGRPFHGQDAQYRGAAMSYRDNGDGTVTDRRTGLTWQKTPDFRMRSWEEAGAYAKGLTLAGRDDWRLPTIKELFSIVDFRGNQHTRTPYIDTRAFDFRYPDAAEGVRGMDAQYWSSNLYVGTTMRADLSAFGFNFADGRVKCYPVAGGRKQARKYVRCVRGPAYGKNAFVDSRDGTVTDRATGLTWTKADSGRAMNWEQALEYAEGLSLAGHSDWRLPDVKELQSIVDYARAPDARAPSARGAAIDPVFEVTDPESWFWSSTTHLENRAGYYVCFGQAFSAWKWRGRKMNAHGAGAVRSDPKSGDPRRWPDGRGPQGDEIRIYNYVRCVRGGDVRMAAAPPVSIRPGAGKETGPVDSRGERFIRRLDVDGDGKVSRAEFDGPGGHFRVLDRDGDGFLTADEAPRGPPPNRGRP